MTGKRKSAGPARSVAHQADFKKIKRKVGKKAPQKANVTNTSFATKSIHIPTQKLTAIDNTNSTSSNPLHSSSATTNSRQLNLSDLFGQIKHYSVSVRKDALLGLKDLVQKHPHVLTLECASILQIILPCILDEDKSVRAALLSLLSFILPTLGTSGIRPFLALINSYICSGLSHMHYTVKRTAVQVLRGVVELGTVKSASSNSSTNNTTSIHTSSNLFLWSSTHAQILPNLLSCLQDRIFFTRQANIATTEALAGKSASSSSSSHMTNAALAHANSNAANVGGNMMNRAQLLACIEAFLALCPDAKKEESLVGSVSSSQNNTLSSAITPSFLYSSSLHSLYSADSLSSAATSAQSGDPTLVDQTLSLMPTRPVPMKYARKSGGGGGGSGNMMFASTTTPSSTSSSTSSSKPTLPINTFISQLLPLSIEYWLETFGLVSNSSSSGGGGGSSSGANSKINTTEYLSNLLSILKLIQLSLNILRNQAVEERRKMIVAGDGDNNLYDPNSTLEHLNLPSTFLPSLRSHIFSLFPFTIETLKLMNRAAWNEQLQRNMNLLNVTCVEVMMMCFGSRNNTISHAMISQHEDITSSFGTSARRKSGSNSKHSRLQTIVHEDSMRLNKIVEYLNEAFQGLIERQGERREGEEMEQGKEVEEEVEEAEEDDEDEDAKEEKTKEENDDEEEEEDAEMEVDDEEEDDAKPEAASTPSTPSRRPPQQSRKSLTPSTPNKSSQHTSSSSSAADKHSSLHSLLTLLPLLLPRLPQERQEELMSKFIEYYTIVHPLSNGKLECLMFLERYLLSATQMTTSMVDQYGVAVSQGMIWWQQNDFRTILFEEGELVTTLIQVMKAIGVEEEKRRDTMRGEVNEKLLQRFSQMYTSILTILLDCGRVFHQKVLDYNVLQTQVGKVFGEVEQHGASSSSSSHPSPSVTLGPFWSLSSLEQQRGFLNLLYYFDVVNEEMVRVIYACIKKLMSERRREQQEEPKDDTEVTSSDPLPSIHLVLDMLHEKHSSFTNGVAGYITLLISLIKCDGTSINSAASSTAAPFSTSRVSALLPKVCTQLRSITDDELNYYAAVSGNGGNSISDTNINITLLDILSPILEECMEANLNLVASSSSSSVSPSSVQPKFDFYTIIILLDCLLPTTATAPISPRLLTLLPRFLWTILSNTLTSSLVESGEKFVLGLGSNLMHFISSSSSSQQQQPWLLPMKLLLRSSHTNVAVDLIQLMQSYLTPTTDVIGLSTQVVIVITALVRCASLRPLLHHHSSLLLPFLSRIRSTPNIASQTLFASLQSEVTMMFGQQATK